MMIEVKENHQTNCSPLNNLYCNLKMRLINNLHENDLNQLYNCSLCNNCHLAGSNKGTRQRAINQDIITSHVFEIKKNISQYGNSYGIESSGIEDKQSNHEVVLFRGCTPTYKTPEILEAAETVLKRENIDYSLITNETCCGNILFNLGDSNAGSKVVKENIKKFKESGVKKIIAICPGCYHAFNKYYKGIDDFNPEIVLAIELLDGSTSIADDIIIQDPCHAREKGDIVRKILTNTKNESASPCCGAGAGVMAHDKELVINKAKKALDNNSVRVVTYCPLCYLNLSSVNGDKTIDIYMLMDEQNKVQASKLVS